SITTSACSPSPTSRRKIPGRPFHNTGMLACQTGPILAEAEPTFRLLRWLALRGSPPGSLDRPAMAYSVPSLARLRPDPAFLRAWFGRSTISDSDRQTYQ